MGKLFSHESSVITGRQAMAWWHENYSGTGNIFPVALQIEPSNMCNSACAFCPSKDITRPRGIMSFDLCRKLIDEAIEHPEFSSIIWYGLADPFTDEGFFEKVEYAREKKVGNMHVSTNAALLDEEKAVRLLDSGITDINISLDGNSKETYEAIRCNLNFDTTCQNVTRFLEMRAERGQKIPSVALRTAYTETTKPEIESYIARWRGLCDSIIIASVANWAGQSEYDNRRDLGGQKPCARLWGIAEITWDGYVPYCCFDVNYSIEIGNVNDESLYEIWNLPKMQEIRRIHTEGRFSELPLCAVCDECRLGENRNAVFVDRNDGKSVSLERHNPRDWEDIAKCLTGRFDYVEA